MVPPTRRDLLGAVGLLTVTAGCGGSGRGDDTPTPTVAADPDRTVANSTESGEELPPTLRLRGGEDAPPVRRPPDERRRRRPLDGDDWDVRSWILDREATETVRVAPDAREAVRSFLADTDFETESVYVQSMRVSSCYTVTLCSVSWGGDGVDTDYGRQLKPYTAACEADTRVYESRLIRIPTKVDGGSYSTSLGGDACRGTRRESRVGHHESGDSHRGPDTTHHRGDTDTDRRTDEQAVGGATAGGGTARSETTSGGTATGVDGR